MGLDAFEVLSRGPCGGHTQIWDLGEARAGLSSLEPWEALRGTYTEEGHVMISSSSWREDGGSGVREDAG